MRLEWSAYAISDRQAIFNYIEADSPKAAALVDERIRRQVERLIQFPESGRPGRMEGTRELVVHRTPFVPIASIVPQSLSCAYCMERRCGPTSSRLIVDS